MSKVSVIVPVCHEARYLRASLDCVIGQTLKELEILCVSDGADSACEEILREAAERDARIRIIEETSRSYGKAVNAGLLAAEGEYIGFLLPGDEAVPDAFRLLYEAAKDNGADLVRSDFYQREDEEDERVILTRVHLCREPEEYGIVFSPEKTPRMTNDILCSWNGLVRRAFLEEHHIRCNESAGLAFQDHGFFLQCYFHAKSGLYLAKPCFRHRLEGDGVVCHGRDNIYAIHQEYDWIRDEMMEEPKIWEAFCHLYWRLRCTGYVATLNHMDASLKREYLRFLSRELKAVEPSGLLLQEAYPAALWEKVQLILHDPDSYADRELNIHKEGASVEAIKRTASYRLGRVLTFLPRMTVWAIRRWRR